MTLQLKRLMSEAGFINVTDVRKPLPLNPWPKGIDQKIIGAMELKNFLEVSHGISMNVLVKVMGWTPEEVDLLLVEVRKNLKDRDVHAYVPL